MIYAAKIVFLIVTLFWICVCVSLAVRHQQVTSSGVVLGVLAIATGCIGTVTTWKFFRPARRDETLPIKGVGEWRKEISE